MANPNIEIPRSKLLEIIFNLQTLLNSFQSALGTEETQNPNVLESEDFLVPMSDPPSVIRMYEVNSSNVSAMAFDAADDTYDNYVGYFRFKGGTLYRYFTLLAAQVAEFYQEAVDKAQGVQEASVGSLFYHAIKVPADEGRITCEKWDDETDTWKTVLPKAKRDSAANRAKAANKQAVKESKLNDSDITFEL